MALHRDIYWVGRQWAVTGYGIQACDQKQKGKFDIEASVLWEDGVLEGVRGLPWLNVEDFDKAVAVARRHYPEPPRGSAPLETSASRASDNAPVEPPAPVAPAFELRIEGWPAKFLATWRIRAKRS
jgi:hypothetical protein